LNNWETVKLKEVFKHKKRNILINDTEEYKLCRVQVRRKGVLLREKQKGKSIKTKKQQVCKAGDFIVAEMDAKFGGYGFIPAELDGAIVSSHYYLFELDKSKMIEEYFQTLINTDFIQNQIEAKGSTNYSSIRAWEFLEYNIPLPSLKVQKKIAHRFMMFFNFKSELGKDTNKQMEIIKKLRQSILQEAIEGKLTFDWRKENPVRKGDPDYDAEALLMAVAKHKEKSIKDKTIKDGTQTSVSKTNRTTKIPKNWKYCKGNNIFFVTKLAGFEYTKYINLKESGEIPVVRAQNVKPLVLDKTNLLYIDKSVSLLLERCALTKPCLLVTFIGAGIGDVALFSEKERWHLAPNVAKMEPLDEQFVNLKYMIYFLLSSDGQKEMLKHIKATAQPSLSMGTIRDIDYIIPPKAEQDIIVERIERLMDGVNMIQREVIQRQEQSNLLINAVLKEAFNN